MSTTQSIHDIIEDHVLERMPVLVEYYVNTGSMSEVEARIITIENPDRVAAAFIVFGGVLEAPY